MSQQQQEPQSVIESSFVSLSRMIEAETDCTTASIDVLERLNLNATKKYTRLADACQGLETDRSYLTDLNKEIEKYMNQVENITAHIENLEALTTELDEWSKELEVKSRRFRQTK